MLAKMLSLLAFAGLPLSLAIDRYETQVLCVSIFETLFPPQQWTSFENIDNFLDRFSSKRDGLFFACPLGDGSGTFSNFETGKLQQWFRKSFNPQHFKYTEWITSHVSISKGTCSFEKSFLALVGDECYVQFDSRLVMELDDKGDLLKWIDHFDKDIATDRFDKCISETYKLPKKSQTHQASENVTETDSDNVKSIPSKQRVESRLGGSRVDVQGEAVVGVKGEKDDL